MKFEETVFTFIEELNRFDYGLSSIDFVWNLIFPDNKEMWHYVNITRYEKTYYISHIDGSYCGLEVVPKKDVKVMDSFGISSHGIGYDDPAAVWTPMIASARKWMKRVNKDWIKANRLIQENYPLNRRRGIVPNALIRSSLPDLYRLDKELGKAKNKKFISLVEQGYFNREKNTIVKSMTAKDYFKYCKLAYIAGKRKEDHVDESISGREMYELYADGRHEGLLNIDDNSQQEFADWIDGKHPRKTRGGHPWEIKRGGNATHIDLSVRRPFYGKEGFEIELSGSAINRLVETVKMFLAIHDASLPISIADAEGIRKRLLAQDNIGLVPCFSSLHRANQAFRKDQHVYDVMHYDDLGRYKRRITPFITWEPLPLIKPKEI